MKGISGRTGISQPTGITIFSFKEGHIRKDGFSIYYSEIKF